MKLKAHISEWWDIANARRQRLILTKHRSKPLSEEQERELQMLQKVAEVIIDFYSPVRISSGLEEATRLAIGVANLHRPDNNVNRLDH